MATDAEKKILDEAIAAIRARAAGHAARPSSADQNQADWYGLGADHATERAIMEIENIRDAW